MRGFFTFKENKTYENTINTIITCFIWVSKYIY